MKTNLKGKDFIDMRDYSREELETILQLALELKLKVATGEPHPLLAGKNLGMLFADDSLRTRISFETGMSQLGGHAQYYTPEKLHLVHSKETWADTAQVISRYLDGFVIRLSRVPPEVKDLTNYGAAQAMIKTIAENADIPVVNAYSDVEHPCQIMADIMTLMEKFGSDYRKRKVAVVWGYSKMRYTPAQSNSLSVVAGALGMNIVFAFPKGFHFDSEYEQMGRKLSQKAGGTFETVHNLNEAVKDADAIYVTPQMAIGKPLEEVDRMRSELKDWSVRSEHFKLAAPGAIFMHAMPVHRDEEAAAEVVDGPMSVMFDQAENRLHVQKAILSLIM